MRKFLVVYLISSLALVIIVRSFLLIFLFGGDGLNTFYPCYPILPKFFPHDQILSSMEGLPDSSCLLRQDIMNIIFYAVLLGILFLVLKKVMK